MKITIRFLAVLLGFTSPLLAGPQVPDGVWVRPGFELSVAMDGLEHARFLHLGENGVLFVSQGNDGSILAARDLDGDGTYEDRTKWVTGYPTVHAMFWHQGELWFTTSPAIFRSRDANGDRQAEEVKTVLEDLPYGGHYYRTLLLHPTDGSAPPRLYTSIGDSGNITDETATDRQKIWTYDLEGKDKKLYCSGIRNTEKLLVRPGTAEIWGMDHGSDWFGRPVGDTEGHQPITNLHPPEEMNRYVEGGFYGHPFIVGYRLPRYEHLEREDIIELAEKTIVPEWGLPAHSACNGMTFVTGATFPADHQGDAFVAMHGSWNRDPPFGYGIARVLFDDGKPYGSLDYVRFLKGQEVLGRPTDVTMAPDGSLLFTDDSSGRIYRLRPRK